MTDPTPDNVINLPFTRQQTPPETPQQEPQSPPQREMTPEERKVAELVQALQAAAALRQNNTHSVRTRELDAEKGEATRVINGYLSKYAFEALHAMEFMHFIVPQMMGNLAHIFSQHRMTYLPLVETFNMIAAERRAQREAKQSEEAPK